MENCYRNEKSVKVESSTSLEAVVRCFDADRVLVVVADTLPLASPKRCYVSVPLTPDKADSYTELVSSVRRSVEEWIVKCSRASTITKMLNEGRLRVEVAHGLGSYQGWVFGRALCKRGGPNPIQAYAGEIVGLMLRELIAMGCIDRLVVDLTHGINYMTVSFKEAAEASISAYVASRGPGSSIELILTNSEPFQKKAELNVYVVDQRRIASENVAEKLSLTLDLESRTTNLGKLVPTCLAGDSRDLGKRVNEIYKRFSINEDFVKKGLAVARALIYSMPLAFLYLARDFKKEAREGENLDPLSKLAKALEEVRRERSKVAVIDKNRREVRHSILFVYRTILLLMYSASLQNYVARTRRALNCDANRLEIEGASLKCLGDVTQYLGRVFRVIAENELDAIGKRCRGDGSGTIGTCDFPVSHSKWPEAECQIASMDPRNLKAHAGLEKNITEARVSNEGELYLRYRKGCWDRLRNVISRADF